MFGLFKKKEDKRDLEKVIYDIAEYGRDEDLHIMYDLIKNRQLYLPVDPSSLPKGLEQGEKIITDSSIQIRIKNVAGPNGEMLVPAASEQHSMVSGGYIGMEWQGLLEMVLKITNAWGVLDQGQTSYVALDNERIKYVLALPIA